MQSISTPPPANLIANRYQIGRLIGRGGMGDVYVATDTFSEKQVAVKQLKPEALAADPQLPARFAHEGKILRELDHPNIVKILDTVDAGPEQYIIMEYMPAGSLRDLLDRNGRLPIEQVVTIALELSDALTRAHHLGIIHRDIKPANVLLADDGTPRLTDFGTAVRLQDGADQHGGITGTYAYLSPEACQSHPLDGRTDIWAQGVVMFEMLTGQRPFKAGNPFGVLAAIMNQPPPYLEDLRPETPEPLISLINRMLAKNKDDRPAGVRQVGAELEAILNGRRPITVRTTDKPSKPTAVRHNLPRQTTPFMGREAELGDIAARLAADDCRLLTILGPGGMGKTRLGIQAAKAQLNHYTDGVFFIPLAALDTADFIPTVIAEQIGFTFAENAVSVTSNPVRPPAQQLLSHLTDKQMLLVLDNFEHILPGADFVNRLLQTAGQIKILVTSRARLNLNAEWIYRVQGLQIPPEDTAPADLTAYSAADLFLHTAQRSRPDITAKSLTSADATAVTRICRLVDGMPLGIELAATWIEMLTPADIVEEITAGLDILETEQRDLPARHRSMRAVFDYSWQTLSEREQLALARLSVFRGGFQRRAAAEIAKATLPLLSTLVNKSLLRQNKLVDEHNRPLIRYELHELLRQFAAERLADRPQVADKTRHDHAAYYADLVAQHTAVLQGDDRRQAIPLMERESENVRQAWRWAAEKGDLDHLEQMQAGLFAFYNAQNQLEEGEQLFTAAVENSTAGNQTEEQIYARLLLKQCSFRIRLGYIENILPVLETAMTIGQKTADETLVADARAEMGSCHSRRGAFDRAQQLWRSALATYRRLEMPYQTANMLLWLGRVEREQGNYQQAHDDLQEALTLNRQVEFGTGIATALLEMNILAYRRNEPAAAENFAREALNIYKLLDDEDGQAQAIRALAIAAGVGGDYEQAEILYLESLEIVRRLGNQLAEGAMLNNLCHTALMRGEYDKAWAYGQQGLALFAKIQNKWGRMYLLDNMGGVAIQQNRLDAARTLLTEAAQMGRQMGAMPLLMACLVSLTQIAHMENEPETALQGILALDQWEAQLMAETKKRKERLHTAVLEDLTTETIQEIQTSDSNLSLDAVIALLTTEKQSSSP